MHHLRYFTGEILAEILVNILPKFLYSDVWSLDFADNRTNVYKV